ncbi:MAG: hypothetical protein IAE93_10830 [Ignavibacteria bacterium]|nr:hypothetical protein [Ignavibacteria bacterium]
MSTIKYLEDSIDFIENLAISSSCKVALTVEEDPKIDGNIELNDDNIKLTMFVPIDKRFDYLEKRNLKISINGTTFIAENFYFNQMQGYSEQGIHEAILHKYIGHVYKLESITNDTEKKLYRRVIFPVDENKSFFFYIENVSYNIKRKGEDEPVGWSRNLINLCLDNYSFDFFFYYKFDTKSNYLIIDSLECINEELFSKYVYCILLTYSFLTGYFPYGESYHFTSKTNDFCELKAKKYLNYGFTLKNNNSTIHANSYAFSYSIGHKLAADYKSKLAEISQPNFNEFILKVFINENLQRALYLFQRANNEELYVRASLYSIVLETVSIIVRKHYKEHYENINSEKSEIIEDFKKRISQIFELDEFYKIDKETQDILLKKIKYLDQPTNSELLLKPFKVLGIELSEEEIKVINYRNNFLHGSHPLMKKNKTSVSTNEMHYICLRLFVVLSKEILKYLGYSGRIINYPKIYENITKIKVNEEPFIKI